VLFWFKAITLIRLQWKVPFKSSQAFSPFTDQSLIIIVLFEIDDMHKHFTPDDNVWIIWPYWEGECLSSARYEIGMHRRNEESQRGSMAWCWVFRAVGAPPCLFIFSCLSPRQKLLKPTLGSRPELTFHLVCSPPKLSLCGYASVLQLTSGLQVFIIPHVNKQEFRLWKGANGSRSSYYGDQSEGRNLCQR